jgi:hypothetical protein
MIGTVERFRAAVEARDPAALDGLFAADIRFESPVKFTPFVGLPLVRGLFGVLFATFEDFRYVGEMAGEVEKNADSHLLVFRATVAGKEIHGIDLLQLDADGLISQFTVMVRPLSAVNALGAAVQAGLVEAGIAK